MNVSVDDVGVHVHFLNRSDREKYPMFADRRPSEVRAAERESLVVRVARLRADARREEDERLVCVPRLSRVDGDGVVRRRRIHLVVRDPFEASAVERVGTRRAPASAPADVGEIWSCWSGGAAGLGSGTPAHRARAAEAVATRIDRTIQAPSRGHRP